MEIAAALETTLQDFPGKIAAEVFTRDCNFRCPHCHARQVLEGSLPPVREEDFLDFCSSSGGWVNGVSICGGEPALQPDLEEFVKKVRALGLSVKIDTNGSCPEVLEKLLSAGLVDYVAMDIKGPPYLWDSITGVKCPADRIKESMLVVQCFPQYEFRTTAVPVLRADDTISFITPEEMENTARFITEHTGRKDHRYFIQKFIPRENGLLDVRMEKFSETPFQLLEQMEKAVRKYLPEVQLRGC